MEPSGAIHPKNHARYTRHNSPPAAVSHIRQRSRPFPGRPWDGVSGAVVDTAANSVAVAGTSLSTPGVFGFAQSDVSAASNLAGTGLRAPGRPLDRSLSSKRGRRRGAVRAHPLFRLRASLPSALGPFAVDAHR